MIDTYTETGGIRFGSGFNATWPCAKLLATQDSVVINIQTGIRSIDSTINLKKISVREISKVRGIFSTGIHIEHDDDSQESYILFWTFKYKRLKQALVDLGYCVSD